MQRFSAKSSRKTIDCGGLTPPLRVGASTPITVMTLVYKICPRTLWREAELAGVFEGSPVDRADGYIHFSTAAQTPDTASRHFAGQADLLLVAVEAERLGGTLRHEPSRGGDLFPHLYGILPLAAVRWVKPLLLGPDGRHVVPNLE